MPRVKPDAVVSALPPIDRLLTRTDPTALPTTLDPRQELARWMVAPENPFFARSLVNRYWKHFFAVILLRLREKAFTLMHRIQAGENELFVA